LPKTTKNGQPKEFYQRAADLGVPGRSKMSKQELARAIARKQD
jgi:hypothetical protein